MTLEKEISQAILEETKKLILRYHEYHNRVHIEYIRNKKRLGDSTPPKIIHTPDYWQTDNKFNPFYVRKNIRV